MLGSITPLGERGRNSRWTVTAIAHTVGSAVAGVLFGAALGWAGRAAGAPWGGTLAVLALGSMIAVGAILDMRLLPGAARVPSVRRQVNENWLTRYRGWVYGLGFGFQLGLGVVTIVTVSAVYSTFAAAALSGAPGAGAAIGGVFGLVRGLSVLSVARVRRPEQLGALHARILAWDRPSRRLAIAAELALGAAAVSAAVL